MSSKLRTSLLAVTLAMATSACATNHLLEWSKGEPSMFHQPLDKQNQAMLWPGATVVAFLPFVAWDAVTFPFQLVWGIYPYGGRLEPDPYDQTIDEGQ